MHSPAAGSHAKLHALLTVHVVSHTHWDREWYHPAERFRQRLVALVDELLDHPAVNGASFLLDGQTVILEDYLDVKPERASDLASALRDRRIEAGPWYVLADELIPGGEALVRNLLAGRRTLRALRADAPPVLYCPDSFGHPASLPELARGFDKTLVILWRGFGGSRAPKGDTFWWHAPSGERVLLYHLTRSGYELGANLPADRDQTRSRWKRIRAEFDGRSSTGDVLLLNGADHHARQRELAAGLQALRDAAKPDEITPGTLADFASALQTRASSGQIAQVAGELRDSYGYTWTLQGTLASRTPQKRRYALAERMLVRDVEPWVALATFHGAASRRQLTYAAWTPLLLCQPHDTLCGCSIDAVARAMDGRLESAATQGDGLRDDALLDLMGHDRDAARQRPADWRPLLVVRNPSARTRSGVALVEVTVKLADVPVGPGSNASGGERAVAEHGAFADMVLGHERTEAPRAYPDNDAVARFHVAIWVKDVPAYGLTMLPLGEDTDAPPVAPDRVAAKGRSMSNGRLTVRWDAHGRITLEDTGARRTIRNLIDWESRGDEGDLYTPSIRGLRLKPRHVGTKVLHTGPTSGVVEQRWRFTARDERVELRLRWVLDAGARFLRFGVLGDNNARDHRLRLKVRTDFTGGVTVADAAFGAVQRDPLNVPAADRKMETPVPTAPLHRYVSLFGAKRGATLFSDGLTEYETTKEGFAVTVLRAVGELSRNDLPERPGHAGWPEATPEAQCIGPFEAEFGLLLHGARSAATTDEIERVADDVLFPLTGETLRSALETPPPFHGVALEGGGLSFSCAKESEDGGWLVLRCVNLLDREVAGAWRLGRTLREARLARLDETPVTPLECRGDAIPFLAPPRGLVTILVR